MPNMSTITMEVPAKTSKLLPSKAVYEGSSNNMPQITMDTSNLTSRDWTFQSSQLGSQTCGTRRSKKSWHEKCCKRSFTYVLGQLNMRIFLVKTRANKPCIMSVTSWTITQLSPGIWMAHLESASLIWWSNSLMTKDNKATKTSMLEFHYSSSHCSFLQTNGQHLIQTRSLKEKYIETGSRSFNRPHLSLTCCPNLSWQY